MAIKTNANSYAFPYSVCRNISSPDDDAAGRKIYSGHAPAGSVLALEDNENVRDYLVDAKGSFKRSSEPLRKLSYNRAFWIATAA